MFSSATQAKLVSSGAPRIINSVSVHGVNQAILRNFTSKDILKLFKKVGLF
jgi:hypothetical protein